MKQSFVPKPVTKPKESQQLARKVRSSPSNRSQPKRGREDEPSEESDRPDKMTVTDVLRDMNTLLVGALAPGTPATEGRIVATLAYIEDQVNNLSSQVNRLTELATKQNEMLDALLRILGNSNSKK